MAPAHFLGIYDNVDKEIIDIHPYRELAEKRIDKLLSFTNTPKSENTRYIIGQLTDCIDWYMQDNAESIKHFNI